MVYPKLECKTEKLGIKVEFYSGWANYEIGNKGNLPCDLLYVSLLLRILLYCSSLSFTNILSLHSVCPITWRAFDLDCKAPLAATQEACLFSKSSPRACLTLDSSRKSNPNFCYQCFWLMAKHLGLEPKAFSLVSQNVLELQQLFGMCPLF